LPDHAAVRPAGRRRVVTSHYDRATIGFPPAGDDTAGTCIRGVSRRAQRRKLTKRAGVHEHFSALTCREFAAASRLRGVHPLATSLCQDLAVVGLPGCGVGADVGDGFELRHKRLLNMRVSSTITEHEVSLAFAVRVLRVKLVNANAMRYAAC